jgi:energy-converting hydrogenase A subunit R
VGKKFFVSDCEGPLSVNDNAFELAAHFIPQGERFFQIVSRYDDILVDEVKKPGYNAGDTLKLILPFLKAYGASNQNVQEFSSRNILMIPGAQKTLRLVNRTMPSFIISTSYQHYIQALCELTGFPFENCYCTQLDLDKHNLIPEEAKKLHLLRKSIVENPEFENLEKIFWEDIPQMEVGAFLEEVKPVGGEAKKEAVLDIISQNHFQPNELIYIGDSITDVESLRFAQEHDGLAVSFNGNEYAMEEASIAIISDNTLITSIIADLFNRYNSSVVLEFAASFSRNPEASISKHPINQEMALQLKGTNTRLEVVTCDNLEILKEESSQFRKQIRGENIGGLG